MNWNKIFREYFIFHLVFAITVIFILVFSQKSSIAQRFVQDTLVVSFTGRDGFKPLPVMVDTVIDRRDERPRLIGRYEKNKYLFVPVDLLICTEKPLSNEIANSLNWQSLNDNLLQINLIIDEFSLTKKTNSRFFPHYLLNASFSIFKRNSNGAQEDAGQLLYECISRKPLFRDNLKRGFESVIQKCQQELYSDLSHLSNGTSLQRLSLLDNFRSEQYLGRQINMYGGIDFVVGTDGWMTDSEIIFSHREARKKFLRNGYIIRYRNSNKFDSIEYGLTDDILFYRLHKTLVLRGKSQIFIGFNRWKDIKTIDHKFYDAFIFDFSMSQCFIYNPLDSRSFIFGAGILENIFYIYSRGFKFQLGLLLHLGIKL